MERASPYGTADRLGLALGLGPGIVLLLTALLTLADVVGRNLLNAPVPGATELTELALVAITFLLYPRVAWRDTHIAVDLLDGFMGRIAQRLQLLLVAAIGTVAFGALAWRIWLLGERVTGYGDVTPYLRVPLGPIYYAMAILCALTALAHVVRLVLAVAAPDRLPDALGAQAKGIE